MIKIKYLIIIAAIIGLLVLYYFYSEISDVRKLLTSTYQKTLVLESKTIELDKKSNIRLDNNKKFSRTDSPILSITYNSDMVKKNGNLSVKYADLTETEANNLLKQINHKDQLNIKNNKMVDSNDNTNNNSVNNSINKIINDQTKNTSDLHKFDKNFHSTMKNIQNDDNILQDFNNSIFQQNTINKTDKINESNKINKINEEDSFDLDIKNILNNNKLSLNNYKYDNKDNINVPINSTKHSEMNEFQNILNSLPDDICDIESINSSDDKYDDNVLRSINESIKYADTTSDAISTCYNTLSINSDSYEELSNIDVNKNLKQSNPKNGSKIRPKIKSKIDPKSASKIVSKTNLKPKTNTNSKQNSNTNSKQNPNTNSKENPNTNSKQNSKTNSKNTIKKNIRK
ncbi:hypothetical protein QLL95_gp1073 [Cotonvirus japonicus]|uniref:Uncharacterized protein n=1 Tax=Cotonvirus japonicus TaxID=2811091 RepID=A0ABM7NSB4_9VIRU|nr:hypothetical protein QLL95_gp1073 [Cotonvirus japonicus]BCS83050.1 hypothetical protein [Cotonvirus japonicus]